MSGKFVDRLISFAFLTSSVLNESDTEQIACRVRPDYTRRFIWVLAFRLVETMSHRIRELNDEVARLKGLELA